MPQENTGTRDRLNQQLPDPLQETVVPGKIEVTMNLQDSVTMDQFTAMLAFIQGALNQFTHLLSSVEIESTPPAAVEVALTVTVLGATQETVAADVLQRIQDALQSANGVQYNVQVAGQPQTVSIASPRPHKVALALHAPIANKEHPDGRG
jgi:hypothetical protein